MSHYSVMVIGHKPEKQLAPFNENLEMPRYVRYTKEQVIEEGRENIALYKKNYYDVYLKDPVKYAEDCNENVRESHIKYVSEEFPKKLKWTDEEVYQDFIEDYSDDPDSIGKDGEIYSTANPKAKWDWYTLGGRYSGLLISKLTGESVDSTVWNFLLSTSGRRILC